jgi:hypothetical protein
LTLAAAHYDGLMKPEKAPGYWPVRLALATVILLPVALAVLWFSAPKPIGSMPYDPHFGWAGTAIFAVGVLIYLIGVVWMLRIFRGSRDEAPPWRYRDRQ